MKGLNSDIALFKKYLEEKGRLSESSIKVYAGSVERFLIKDPNIYDLSSYNDFLIDLVYKKNSAHYYYALKKYINWKIEDKSKRDEILKNLTLPVLKDPQIKRKQLSKQEILNVISKLSNKKHQAIALIQHLTGARAGDILKLKKPNGLIFTKEDDDIILTLNIIGKGKKLKPKVIYDKGAIDFILNTTYDLQEIEEYYFLTYSTMKNRKGSLEKFDKLITMNYNQFWKDLKEACLKCGYSTKDFATHDFRRCFAKEIYEHNDRDIYILQRMLGHENINVTARYLQHTGLDTKHILKKYQQE